MGSIFYIASITAVKLSLVCFMLRVFPDRRFRQICLGVMALVTAYGVSFVLATSFQCWPVQYTWNQVDSAYSGRCNNIHLQGWLAAAFNILLDVLLLVLPLRSLWNLGMRLKKRFMVMGMFSLGIFVTVISIVRLQSLIRFANSQNITCTCRPPSPDSSILHHTQISFCSGWLTSTSL